MKKFIFIWTITFFCLINSKNIGFKYMKKVKVILVKAFTKNSNQGNPAGIILNADELTAEEMRTITEKTGFSECAFLQKSDSADFKIRFFTSKQEVDLCGHATIACLSIIKDFKNKSDLNTIQFNFQTNVGILPVWYHQDGFIEMEQADPIFIDFKINKHDIAKLLSINESEIIYDPQIISTGSPKLIIGVNSLETLYKIKPDLEGIKNYCKISGARGFYVFTNETLENSDFHARQFNPLAGIDEDPVTGVAAGALGVYIKHHKILFKNLLIIEQGAILNKFGKIFVNVSDKVKVGGYAIKYGEQEYVI